LGTAPSTLAPAAVTAPSSSQGSITTDIDIGAFVALEIHSNHLPWTDDDDDDMPSISKELQDIEKLKSGGDNWRLFRTRVIIACRALNIHEHLENEVTAPSDADALKTHNAVKGQLLNAIVQKLPSDVLMRHAEEDQPHKLWKALATEFGIVSIASTAGIESKMFALRCKPDGDMRKYITEMLELKQQLAEAGADADISDRRFRDALITGARGAGPSYVAIIESMMMSYTIGGKEADFTSAVVIASLRSAYDSLRALKNSSLQSNSAQANSAQSGKKPSRGRGGGRGGRSGHRGGSQQSNGQDGSRKCYNCNGRGHLSRDCPSPRKDSQQANGASSDNKKKKAGKQSSNMAAGNAAAARSAQIEEIASAADAWSASAGRFAESTHHIDCSDIADAFAAASTGPRYDAVEALASTTQGELHVVDSGASEHMTPYRHLLTEYRPILPVPINAANKTTFKGVGRGTLTLDVPKNNSTTEVKITDVLFAPQMAATLISVGKLDDAGYEIHTKGGMMRCYNARGTLVATIPKTRGLYRIGQGINATTALAAQPTKLSLAELHERLGHRNYRTVLDMIRHGRITGVQLTDHEQPECRACMLGKAERSIVLKARTSPLAKKYGDHVHLDLWGPATVQTIHHHRYIFFIVDDYSRWPEGPTMAHKSDSFAEYVAWEAREELQSNIKVKINQSDRGGEFLNEKWDTHIVRKGTLRKLTVHDTPEHNGVAERTNYTILNMVRTFLVASGLPKWLWGEAVRYALYIFRRSAHSALGGKTPYEVRFGKAPNVSNLWPWGSVVYVHQDEKNRSKLEPRALEARWLGFDESSNGHRVYWPVRRSISVERSVRLSTQEMRIDEGEPDVNIGPLEPQDELTAPVPASTTPAPAPERPETPPPPATQSTIVVPDELVYVEPVEPLIVTGKRARKVSRKIADIERGVAVAKSAESIELALAAETADVLDDPRTLKEAMARPNSARWQEAMNEELRKLTQRQSWIPVNHPGRDVNIITGKWVFRTKRDKDGNVVGYRARFVARGFTQEPGQDYHEDDTFAAVAKLASSRYFLSLAAQNGWHVHQIDIKSAYLYGKLREDEQIYLTPPPGVEVPGLKSGQVLRLLVALYGLKQAGRRWYSELRRVLEQLGFKRSEHDHALFYRRHPDDSSSIIFVHVDDMALITRTLERMQQLKLNMAKVFELTDNGVMSWMLGIQVSIMNRCLRLSQTAYIRAIVARFGLQDMRPFTIPADPHVVFKPEMQPSDDGDRQAMSKLPYREMLGSLMYAAVATRPDIAYAVNTLARYQENPGPAHFTALKRIFAYLHATANYCLTFDAMGTASPLAGYVDADGHSTEGRHAVSGYVFTMNGGAVSWSSKRQELVTLSTTEAEYVAQTHAAKEALWLSMLRSEVLGKTHAPLTLYADNQGAIALARDDRFHARTKHIDIRYHFIRELVEQKKIMLTYTPSASNVADVLTKALASSQFKLLASKLGLRQA
jgi:hypothetical protein